MPHITLSPVIDAVRHAASPLTGETTDYDPLLELIGDARFVLLGEASHGTQEFYHARAQITQRHSREKGFTAVAVEADWPDTYRVNRYVRSVGDDVSSHEALIGFQRFPTWMWRNTEVLAFVDWLRAHNAARPSPAPQVGFYGLDLYSLYTSIEAVLDYFNVSATELRRQRADIASADARLQNEQRRAAANPPRVTPEPLPPTLPPPQSEPPSPPNYESKPFARKDTPDVPSPVQPTPAKPGLPQPPMPEPAKPGLLPPPMPQPAEPPALSGGPGPEPPPATPEQRPTVPAPEPTALSTDQTRQTSK